MEAVKYKVVNQTGAEAGSIELDARVFNAPILAHLVHETVRWQRARRRAGTHSSLTKGMMKGGNKKPFAQKGTGRARAGSNTSPLWVGGGKAHGPQPRDYDYRLPKQTRVQALTSVLTDKVKNATLIVVDDLQIASAKTKDATALLAKLGLTGKKAVIVNEANQASLIRSVNNIPGILPTSIAGVNVYDLVRHRYLVVSKSGVGHLVKKLFAESV